MQIYRSLQALCLKVMELDTKAFQSCGIEGLTISNSSLELGENVFSYCEDLISESMENSTLEIGTYSFYDCPAEENFAY